MASYTLHQCVFQNDVAKLVSLLTAHHVDIKDKHGNTALHLAAMLGRKECTYVLMAHNASVEKFNLAGWTPLNEAVSFGDRDTIIAMLRHKVVMDQARFYWEEAPKLAAALSGVPDFSTEIKMKVKCSIPCVSCLLPPVVCLIRKRGVCLHLDMPATDSEDQLLNLGDVSLLMDLQQPPYQMFRVIDHVQGRFWAKDTFYKTELEYEKEADELMSKEILSYGVEIKNVTFTRARSGFICKKDKRETVGEFKADVYDVRVKGLKYRKEHLIAKPISMENSTHRPSLHPPRVTIVSWHTYTHSPAGDYPTLGREQVIRHNKKGFKGKVSMSTDFPLSKAMLFNIISVFTPVEEQNDLKVLQLHVPLGFPVQGGFRFMPMIKVNFFFQKFRLTSGMNEDVFKVPERYTDATNDATYKRPKLCIFQ